MSRQRLIWQSTARRNNHVYEADEDAVYEDVIEIDLSEVRPTVAFPHLPGNAKTSDEVEADEPIKIDPGSDRFLYKWTYV